MRRTKVYVIIGLFFLALVFRLIKLNNLIYFSSDEEMVGFVLRRMSVGHHPVLTFPLATLGLSFGPFFSWLALPFYALAGSRYQYLFYLGPLLGAITTAVVYLIASRIWSRRIGIISALIYAGSFFISIYDRRFWPHSLNPILSILNLWALYQLVRGNYRWSILVAATVMFGWHSDPSILALMAATILTMTWFRLFSWRREYWPALVILLISLAPLVFFDFRHQGINLRRLIQLFQRPMAKQVSSVNQLSVGQVLLTGLGHIFYLSPSNKIDQQFCYCHSPNYWTPTAGLATGFVAAALIYLLIRAGWQRKPGDLLLIFQLVAILGGILFYHWIFSGEVFQTYLTMAFPGVAIAMALLISRWPRKVFYPLIAVWLFINGYSLMASKMRITLAEKFEISQWIIEQAQGKPYELKVNGKGLVNGGGWTYLLTELGDQPEKSYIDPVFSWLYLRQSIEPVQGETALITDKGVEFEPEGKEIIITKEGIGLFEIYFFKEKKDIL